MGTCCDVSKQHARASSEGKAGSGNIGAKKACCAGESEGAAGLQEAAGADEPTSSTQLMGDPNLLMPPTSPAVAGKCAARQSVVDPNLLMPDGTDPACCGH